MDNESLIELLVRVPFLLLGLTIHEFAHARTALAYGDATARDMGRCSLNPLVHLDFMGTICLLFSGFMGWAKPVPVNRDNLHPPRMGEIMVSLAGPMSNLMLAVILGLLLRVILPVLHNHPETWTSPFVVYGLDMLEAGLLGNIGLFVFNLIPLYPLDGHHIARELLPPHQTQDFMNWQLRYGAYILLALVFLPKVLTRVFDRPVIDPIGIMYGYAMQTILPLLGLA